MSAAQEIINAAFDDLDNNNVADFSAAQKKRHYAQHKERRGYISDNDLAFECLSDLFGFDADERAGLHLYVARSMDVAPDEQLFVNEAEIGRLLPGDGDVTKESLKKRCYRFFQRIDERQRLAGRQALHRIQGKYLQVERKGGTAASKETLIAPEYRVWFTQGIAEVVDAARAMRLKSRRDRFKHAALAVFEGDVFPVCEPKVEPEVETPFVRSSDELKIKVDPAETYEAVTGEKSPAAAKPAEPKREGAQRHPRMIRRFKENAALALERAKEKSGEALILQAATLYVELGREVERALGGDAEDTKTVIQQAIALLETVLNSPSDLSSIEASIASLEAKDILDRDDPNNPEFAARTFDPKTQKPQQKRDSEPQGLDTSVQHKGSGKRISTEFKEEVRDRSDIVQIVSAHVELKRKGSEFGGCCPFHDEKTGSFSVNPAKGVYYCFGCQAKGDVFKFVMETEGLQFRDAIKAVAERSGVGWPDEYEQKRESTRAESPRAASPPVEMPAENVEVFEI